MSLLLPRLLACAPSLLVPAVLFCVTSPLHSVVCCGTGPPLCVFGLCGTNLVPRKGRSRAVQCQCVVTLKKN